MALIEIKRNPTIRELRQFALFWLPAFLLVVGGIAVYRFDAWNVTAGLAVVAVVSIAVGLARPAWMRWVFLGWMWAAFPIGFVVSHLLMGSIYYLVMTPIGWIMRLVGRDSMGLKFDRAAQTYWVRRTEDVEPSRYFRQF